jgi:hypothetical protein
MELILYSHDDCPLCDRLEAMIEPHLQRLGATLIKRNIKTNRDWLRAYRYRIPVLTLDDRVLLEGRPEPTEVDRVMTSLPSAPGP